MNQSVTEAARRLLGCVLERRIDGHILRVKIVETEAYDETDVASHSYRGETARTRDMFGPAGRLYVYFTYGMHYCCNVVTGPVGTGAAVLIRAVEPIEGTGYIAHRRMREGVEITNGPAKLCHALGIDIRLGGHDLHKEPLKLVTQPPVPHGSITQTSRVGITKGINTPWRFFITGNPYVSKP
ncbi:MAG: DNA-3-methyladenine glycosylase [Candidatus Saccharimonas sp.]